jgi:uncharacterized membrane protein
MTTPRTLVLVLATLSMGLAAGAFYTFQISVMRGLAVTDDRTFVSAMHGINVKIQNAWFFLSFVGAMLLTIVTAVLFFGRDGFGWILASLVLYGAVIVITGTRNVPMNNALDAAADHDPPATRRAFEKPWVRWNLVRTWLSFAAFTGLVMAVLSQ